MSKKGNQQIYEHLNTICSYIHRGKSQNQLKLIKFSYTMACFACEHYFIRQPKNLDSFVRKFVNDEERISTLIPIDKELNILTGLEKNEQQVTSDRFFIGLFFYLCMFLKYTQEKGENINRVPDLMKTTPDELFSRIIILGQQYNSINNYCDHKKTTLVCGLGNFFHFYGNHLRILEEEGKITEELFIKTTDVWVLLKLIENEADIDVFTKECKPKEFKSLNYDNALQNHFITCVFNCIFNELLTNEKISHAFPLYIKDIMAVKDKMEKVRPTSRFSIFTSYFIF